MATTNRKTQPQSVGVKNKISVSLTDEAVEAVEEIAQSRGITVSEAIRRAIAIERFIVNELDDGATFLVRRKDGDTERLQFVWG